ncbi:MAG: YebC/PmpR family DNA-binding transcriptional regulator [Candidatus Izimaplasma sp.]|nr:YebC/PmpR family DNA-binding transcriptional regulator [Candidatus Izimaplasma bacterium]
MKKTMLRKSKLYSRYGKEIYMCAKEGGTSLEANLTLKHLVDQAKKEEVPNDVIERNIKKAEEGTGEDFEPQRYEGFGPGGVGIIVDTLTDNINRTVAEVRAAFAKADSKIGVNGSVEHGYKHLSYVRIKEMDQEEALETLLMEDIDVLDLSIDDDIVEVEGEGFDLNKIRKALEDAGAAIEDTERGWYPMEYIELDEETKERFDALVEKLNEIEDVQNIYHNAK